MISSLKAEVAPFLFFSFQKIGFIIWKDHDFSSIAPRDPCSHFITTEINSILLFSIPPKFLLDFIYSIFSNNEMQNAQIILSSMPFFGLATIGAILMLDSVGALLIFIASLQRLIKIKKS